MTTDEIARLSRRLVDLGVRPDDDDDYDEFEEIIFDLHDMLKVAGWGTNSDS